MPRIDGLAMLMAMGLLVLAFFGGRMYQALFGESGCPTKNPTVGECLGCEHHDGCAARKIRQAAV